LTPEPRSQRAPAGELRRVWIKYGGALLLSAIALWAGLSGLGPWPESGLVSGLILVATGPFFALRLSTTESRASAPHDSARLQSRAPWLTAAVGLVEIAAVMISAVGGR
jgi:hypothetical protein